MDKLCCECKIKIQKDPDNSCSICKNNEMIYCKKCLNLCSECKINICIKCAKTCKICGKIFCMKYLYKGKVCNQCEKYKGNVLATENEWNLLSDLCGKKLQMQLLLFKASVDGLNAVNFHSKCDNKGPTITLIKSEFGQVFGGYISQSWGKNCNDCTDENSFVFSLTQCQIYRRLGYHSHYDNNTYGPWFGNTQFGIGRGESNDKIINNFCKSEDYSTSGISFEKSSARISGSPNGRFTAQEVEVYRINII